ncbi:MAG: hypothetical protein U1F27_13325 [Turneriella sp.]
MRAQELDLEFAAGIDLTIAAETMRCSGRCRRRSCAKTCRSPTRSSTATCSTPDAEAPPEYFVATDSVDSEMLIRLFSCISDKLVVLAEKEAGQAAQRPEAGQYLLYAS